MTKPSHIFLDKMTCLRRCGPKFQLISMIIVIVVMKLK